MAANQLPIKIKDYLLENKILTQEGLDELSAKTKNKSWEEVLVESKMVSSEDYTAIKAKVFDVPIADLKDKEIPPEILGLLQQKVAENYQMLVFDRAQDVVSVAMVNPGDFVAHEAMEFLANEHGWQAKYYAVSLNIFRKAVQQYTGKKDIGNAVKAAEEKFAAKELLLGKEAEMTSEEAIKSAPVAKIVEVIIRNAVDGGASDIHIEPGRSQSRVRYRVDGILHASLTIPNHLLSAVVSRIKVLASLKLDENRVPQDGRIAANLGGQQVDLRVSVLPMLNSEKVVIRVLDTSAGVPTLAQLGFFEHHIATIERNIKKPFGLFLLTGPTGSGKTTTLYSILKMLNSENSNITTLEDPIEYYMDGINQSQVNPDVGFTFASGLRAILRQDPNIIMVGEVRDNETAELCVHAGLTGHLVFSTLHTNSAIGAMPRLVDMKVEPFLLASTINLVMAQRLVRRICPKCKTEANIPSNVMEMVEEQFKTIPQIYLDDLKVEKKFYRGQGCVECKNTGYVGRTVVIEMIEFTQDLRNIVAEKFEYDKFFEELKKQNYINMMQDGVLKAAKGTTTIEEVLRVTQS